MRIADISVIGWIHTIACTLALILGAWNIFATKGTTPHKWRGFGYVLSMVIANVLALAINRFDINLSAGGVGAGVFGLFHWLAVAALFFTLAGYYASSRQRRRFWPYAHPICMTLSYYLIFGGLINEAFARIDMLRPLAVTMVHGRPQFGSTVVGMTQTAAMFATLGLLILFAIKVWLFRHRARQTG